jgi:hypothetical protein
MTRAKPQQQPDPWKPFAWEPEDAYALRALQAGTATQSQQQRALKWIIEAAGTYDQAYRPGSSRDTDFACGMQHVGKQIVKLLNLSITAITAARDAPDVKK